jgi:four helix bundle protein
MGNFRELKVWQKGHELTLAVYKLTKAFPKEEIFGLTAQMRRASASIGMNLAEGAGRRTDTELRRFATISLGSAQELQYQLLLARDLGYLKPEAYEAAFAASQEVAKMLNGLCDKLAR